MAVRNTMSDIYTVAGIAWLSWDWVMSMGDEVSGRQLLADQSPRTHQSVGQMQLIWRCDILPTSVSVCRIVSDPCMQ